MSFLSIDPSATPVRKAGNVLLPVGIGGGAPPVVAATLNPTFASMVHAAVYQGAVPGIIELGGTLDPATAGAAVALSNGNLTATFSGVGSVLSTVDLFTAFTDTCWEFVVAPAVGSWDGAGIWTDGGGGVPYNANAVAGGNAADSERYTLAGAVLGAFPGVGIALVAGDVLGFTWSAAGAANAFNVYVNGVLVVAGAGTSAGGSTRRPLLSS